MTWLTPKQDGIIGEEKEEGARDALRFLFFRE